MTESSRGKCEVCGKSAKQFCSSCKLVFYCSRDCQKESWKTHKTQCRCFIIETHPVYGRYVVAARDIKAGEIILKESPFILGPKQFTIPLCLGCHSKLQGTNYFCKHCHYPLCSSACQSSNLHKDECSVLSKAKDPVFFKDLGVPSPAYECITPLRCLLLKRNNPVKYETMMKLQSHKEDFKTTDIYNVNKRNIVEFIRIFIGYEEVDEETIYEICGILHTNSFELKSNGSRIRAMYFNAAMFAHSCTHNTKHAFDKELNIIFRATLPIKKGEAIFTTYSHTLWDTVSRRQQLQISKFFLCECDRCQDPTELESNISTLMCVKCGGEVRSCDPLNQNSDWMCSRCEHTLLARQVGFGNEMMNKELRGLNEGIPKSLENFLTRYKKTFHPNHRFMTEAKYALIKYYGNSPNLRYKDLTREQLENKVQWCRDLLTIVEKIDAGQSLIRGTVLFELQAGLVALAKHLHSNDIITKDKTGEYMAEAVGYLQEASAILKQEPEYDNGGLEEKLKWLSAELEI